MNNLVSFVIQRHIQQILKLTKDPVIFSLVKKAVMINKNKILDENTI